MGSSATSLTLLAFLLPFLGAAVAPLLTRSLRHHAAWILALIPAWNFLHFSGFLGEVAGGNVLTGGYAWIPSLGVSFSWLIDGLSLTFALLISGIGTFIVLYSGGYLKGHAQQGRFFSFILLFMGAMQGLVLSDHFLMLFVFWELTTISSFLLIGFDHGRQAARRAALQALIVTGGGGLCLLGGLIVLWMASGADAMSGLLASGDAMRDSALYCVALVLVLGGAFTKSAQFPLHFWLPNAMEAPTPVSAYLHSATMVKAGVYLLMRLNPVMGDTGLWETILPLFGAVTLVAGGVLAVRQTDLKLMLAYTTVASLGLLVMLTGVGSPRAIEAAVLYLIAHSLFKGALFMVAGAIDHNAGTRDLTALSGLRTAMPVTFAVAMVAALSMGGLPPFAGFLAKEEIYAALLPGGAATMLLMAAAILGNALMFAIAFAVAFLPFAGDRRHELEEAGDGPVTLWIGPAVLAATGLLLALAASFYRELVAGPMASAVAGEAVAIHASPVPHVGLPLLLSALTVALGMVLLLRLPALRDGVARSLAAIGWGPDKGFDQAISGVLRLAVALTGILHNGSMRIYMRVVFAAIAAAILVPMIAFSELPHWPEMPVLRFYEWAVFGIAVIGLVAIAFSQNRLTALILLGVQGFAVAMLYMLFGAPDLSFTQFMVETLSVVILALVMTKLRLDLSDPRPVGSRLVAGIIALCCGTGFALLMLKVTQVPFDPTLTEFFNANSRLIAHGRNVVNVIIVDFRGLDTMGEITVVLIAGLAILALLRVRGGRTKTHGPAVPAAPAAAAAIGKRESVEA